eukprot:TRINITY_DN2460_c0_g1_i8.p1 TRINITY_DN2460_c0_g1~~TRINITY_DN2460_c0_g1_i8.p1  ORF type:complete len:304 (+),score=45.26 TRINITY_DN2460_c0_g1_i8:64-975(+)
MCIRDRSTWGSMQKSKAFEKEYHLNRISDPSEGKQPQFVRAARRISVKTSQNQRITFLRNLMIRSDERMADDLYYVMSPFVANVRGQCGLVGSNEAIASRPAEKHRKRSIAKRQLDIVTVKRDLGEPKTSFPDEAAMKDAEAFDMFVANLTSLLQHRGLAITDDQFEVIQTDQLSRFWLSDPTFSINPNASIVKETNLFSILQKDKKIRNFLRSCIDFLENFPTFERFFHPIHRFETRQNRMSTASLSYLLRQISHEATLSCLTKLIYLARDSVLQSSLTKIRAFDWTQLPLKEFVFYEYDLR